MDMDLDPAAEEPVSAFILMPEIVRDAVLRYLSPSEFLSLRRVCKTTKGWIEEFSAKRPSLWKNFRLVLGTNGWKSFEAVLESGLWISSFYLDNPVEAGIEIYKSQGAQEFMESICPAIKKLRVRNFFTCRSQAELQFFDGMTSLEELRLDNIHAETRSNSEKNFVFPGSFKNVKILKLGHVTLSGPLASNYHWELMKFCSGLEYFGYPSVNPASYRRKHSENEFDKVMDYMKKQEEEGRKPLKHLDLKRYDDLREISISAEDFIRFLQFVQGKPLKLHNVHGWFFEAADPSDQPEDILELYECIQSLNNATPPVLLLQLNDMEEISVAMYPSTATSFDGAYGEYPKLKRIKIKFKEIERGGPDQRDVVHWLLRDYPRPSVQELKVVCSDEVAGRVFTGLVKARYIVDNFPNLTSLKLVKCNLTNRAYLRLWAGLPLLDRLWIEDCSALGNVALIGENLAEPVFLTLTRLRDLTLKLDSMPKLSDRCFSDVFRHMELQKFAINCTAPLSKITELGISTLLEGKFANSVQRFSIDHAAFPSMSSQEFTNFIRRFRSLR